MSDQAAKRFLAYIDKQSSKAQSFDSLTEYFDSNWEKVLEASCKKYNLSKEELISAIIDNL